MSERPHWLVPLSPEEDEELARETATDPCQDCTGHCIVCDHP